MTSSDFSDRVRNYPSARHGPLAHREKYRPGQLEKINDRKAAFDRLNRFIMARGGWITSIPGDRLVVVEAVSATTASDLADLGYSPIEIEGGQRIMSAAVEECFTRTAAGALEPWTEGSARPVAEVRRHAGFVPTLRWSLVL
jgi:hypothetical protein